MPKKHPHDEKPWEPTLDTLPVFNPFVSPTEHLDEQQPAFPADEVEAAEGVSADADPLDAAAMTVTAPLHGTPPSRR